MKSRRPCFWLHKKSFRLKTAPKACTIVDGKYYYFDPILGYAKKGNWAGRLYGDDYAGYTGLLETDGTVYYYLDGRSGPCGLVEVDGSYYYSYWGGVIKTGTHYISTSYCDLPVGEYTFGEDGKALNGVYDSVLYANGKKALEATYQKRIARAEKEAE